MFILNNTFSASTLLVGWQKEHKPLKIHCSNLQTCSLDNRALREVGKANSLNKNQKASSSTSHKNNVTSKDNVYGVVVWQAISHFIWRFQNHAMSHQLLDQANQLNLQVHLWEASKPHPPSTLYDSFSLVLQKPLFRFSSELDDRMRIECALVTNIIQS